MVEKHTKHTENLEGYNSPFAIHPGYILREEMDYCGITQKDLADRTGISHKTINAIVAEKHPITKDTAQRLGKVFHSPAHFWFALQQGYDLDLVRLEKEKVLEKEISLLPDFRNAYNELKNIGVFSESFRWSKGNFGEIVDQLQNFFGVASLQFLEEKSIGNFVFRQYKRKNTDIESLAAWLRLGRRKAQTVETQPFNKEKLERSMKEFRSLSLSSHKDYLPEIEKLLAECGIVVAYMPLFANIHTQGAATWMSPNKALIMINTHKRDEGKFWFTLFHEIGHLLLHSKKEQFVSFDTPDNNVDDRKIAQEYEADGFAKKKLLPRYEAMQSQFIEMTEKDNANFKHVVKKIARSEGISSAIFAGRLTHEYKDSDPAIFKKASSLLPTVINRENVIDAARV